MHLTRAAPRPWIAYAPARPSHSQVSRYAARSRGVSSRNVTRVPSCSTTSQPGVIRQRPDMTTCVLPDSSSSICSASEASAGLPKIRPCNTTSVSTPRTGRSPAPAATLRALPCACSRTTSVASGSSGGGTSSYRGSTTSNGMPSCSRIARRCGDRDANKSGAAGGASAMFPRGPDLFVRPLPRPLGRHVLVVRMRLGALGRVQLDETLDLEAVLVQQIDPLPVTEMELDLVRVAPLHPVQPALGPKQTLRRALEVHAQRDERGVAQEDQPSAGARQPRRFRNPAKRVSPDRRAVLGVDDVERLVRKRHVLAIRLDQRELETGLPLHATRRLELRRRGIDADDARASTGEPGGEVRGAAADLDNVEAFDVAEEVQFTLGLLPDAPVDLLGCPRPLGLRVRVLRIGAGPVGDVRVDVVRPLRRAHRP